MNVTNKKWDVVVIGGGPAGMMAAGSAAELGAEVLLLEKNKSLGKKLLITGGGRCNLTNMEPDTRKFLSRFKESDKFLFSAFSQWDVEKTIRFFNKKGMETKVEAENRVFPKSDKAGSVFDVLAAYMEETGVMVLPDSQVSDFQKKANTIEAVKLNDGSKIKAKNFILATGGKSRPETGSTGDGFVWLKNIGHTIVKSDPALVPLSVKDKWVKDAKGISLSDVKISIFQNDVKQISKKGKVLFTHFGLSGPGILNLSRDVGELLKYGDVSVSLDLFPKMNEKELDLEVQELFKKNSNKKLKNTFNDFLPNALASLILKISKVDQEMPCHNIKKEERLKLTKTSKNLLIRVDQLLGFKKAIISSGGVDLKEVDFKDMSSKLFPNLYLVGDILNIDRPSGGYSLQLCWTTGFVSGNSIGRKLLEI